MRQLKDVVLVTIARNEARCIGRLLSSVRPWVDSMVVLDTGSEDDTIKIAREMGATVEQFAWTDDFSAARNAALELAGARWHLVLDADEWIVDGGDWLRQLSMKPAEWAGQIRLDEVLDEQTGTSRHWLSRLLPGHVRYSGRIHEQPLHCLPLKRTPLVVAHDGYSPHLLEAKKGRNRHLLEKELRDHPRDPYLHYQLGKDADIYDDNELAASSFAAAWSKAEASAPWRIDLVVRWIAALKRLGRHPEAAALISEVKAEMNASPDFHFAVGDLMLDWAASEPHEATTMLAQAESAWRQCLALGERPDQSGSVVGRGGDLAAFNLALILEGTGRPGEASELRRQFGLSTGPMLG